MLTVDSVVKTFGRRAAVDRISFELTTGEVLGFLGPNGAGKTTVMRMIAGRLEPDSGKVRVGAHDMIQDRRAGQRLVGYLPEGAPAYRTMTPREFVSFCLSVRGYSGSALRVARERALDRARLGCEANQQIGTLSKGYNRRAALAAAMAHDPPLLVLDEPTDGLDPNQKHEVRALIREMAMDKAIIVSTHILEEVPAVCSRVIVINKGRIVVDESPDEFSGRARSGRLEEAFRSLTRTAAEAAK
ncbi:MAG: multidrug ABC transporter ATP-binding protein [Rhodobacterales bacterium CG15_BIG_FIL_POST_REV_8_21_14_020_59_13]|nr:MAG: multidrug ABC transporter ATP-binding protein [Rhodobacterales bacterium CG15_BIG_FIL_POST_REV_8_21_14_020_59_13]